MRNYEKITRKSSNRYDMEEGQTKGRKFNKTKRGTSMKRMWEV
ncbi:hypothetical protein MidiMira_12 [Proteus phage MidiMira-UFV02]|nr:hypothetical protein BigMira_12 [Proteus phage BigMira-UFV01]WJJ57739.1 hypothetical protein MidiMira_12 [Proteus phage MidiMira-UFV02]